MHGPATILYSASDIGTRVRELGEEIARDYRGREPVVVAVLKGSAPFMADLVRATDLALAVDFMSISSYGSDSRPSGVVRIMKDLDHDIGGRDVVVVEDIVDTGLTMSYLLSVLAAREPVSVEVCTLLDKSVRRIVPLDIRYRGFDCPDRFVVGYGMDYAERYRNLPDIYAVDDMDALAADPLVLSGLLDPRDDPR